jgi:hypothetical protein
LQQNHACFASRANAHLMDPPKRCFGDGCWLEDYRNFGHIFDGFPARAAVHRSLSRRHGHSNGDAALKADQSAN